VPDLSDHLRLLADETRLRILHLLAAEPLTVAELQEILDLSQSSISGHLAKLKHAGLLHDVPQGSSRRYRFRDDLDDGLKRVWTSIRELSQHGDAYASDRTRLADARTRRASTWVERVAGCLHREYAPGRTWESLCHGVVHFARFGRCVDVGAGDGAMAALIAPRADSLTCVDPSPAMVAAGKERIAALRLGNVAYHLARGEELPMADASCDSVLFLQSLQYVDDPARTLAEAQRVLCPGGRLLVLTIVKHSFDEASAFGHRHFGFGPTELTQWTKRLGDHQAYELPPESRLPRFQSLVFSAVKPRGRAS
jgi:DNA-binding transcriptional ArsR family regulator